MSDLKTMLEMGIPAQNATFFLEATGGDLQQAIHMCFDTPAPSFGNQNLLSNKSLFGSSVFGNPSYPYFPSNAHMNLQTHSGDRDGNRDSSTIWEWEERGVWQPFDKETTDILESAILLKSSVNLNSGNYFSRYPMTYKVDLVNMVQINMRTGFQRRVRRVKGKKQREQSLFKDPDEQFLKDEQDRLNDEAKTNKLSQYFYKINGPMAHHNIPKPALVVEALQFCYEQLDHKWESKRREEGECQICFSGKTLAIDGCGCKVSCGTCIGRYLEDRVESKEVMPWLPCPGDTCNHPLPTSTISKILKPELLAKFAEEYISKMLARSQAWVQCSSCPAGFFFPGDPTKTAACQKTCPCCGKRQTVSKNVATDKGLEEMLKSGILRKCPQKGCQFPQMKDKGLCNIMHCGKCKTWWNWRTRETGQSMKEMKDRARRHGSLWEPGELNYQRSLEHSNPAAFRRLLERNGMKYDPNYVRGM